MLYGLFMIQKFLAIRRCLLPNCRSKFVFQHKNFDEMGEMLRKGELFDHPKRRNKRKT